MMFRYGSWGLESLSSPMQKMEDPGFEPKLFWLWPWVLPLTLGTYIFAPFYAPSVGPLGRVKGRWAWIRSAPDPQDTSAAIKKQKVNSAPESSLLSLPWQVFFPDIWEREINLKLTHRQNAEGNFTLKIRTEAVPLQGGESAHCLCL